MWTHTGFLTEDREILSITLYNGLKLRDLPWDKGRKFVRSFPPASPDKIINQMPSPP
jgi:hypothetical protein